MQKLETKRWLGAMPPDQGTVAKSWAKDGFDCGLWVDPPGQAWLDFVHSTDERVMVGEGTLDLEVDGVRAILGPGDEAFIPAGAQHSVWNRGSTVARWFFGYRRLR